MTVDLTGKTAIVTGAGRGIGRAIALDLGKHGAHIFCAARTARQIESVAIEIVAAGGTATPIVCDLSNEQSICDMFTQVTRKFERLDILINNAGIGIYGPIAEFSTADFDNVISVNLRGTFLCSREAMKLMVPAHSGYIINISSVVGFKGYVNQGAYTAAKHGVVGLTKTLAIEAQENGIRASVVLPGGVDTEMVARSRPDLDRSVLIQPSDIAHTVAYLLSLPATCAVDQIYIRRRNSTPFG
ncbi:MAG: SDR family oxidoreductase [Phycisphaerae bacterium]|nr:SDR family oxidoreductase [Phycisphaerae bacterium]